MKIHRILGILWLALCCYSVLNLLRALLEIPPTAGAAWWVLVVDCLLYLVGIVACIFLFRGARWARWIVGLVAGFVVLSSIVSVASQRALPVWAIGPGLFALASLVVLFSSRHESFA